MLRLNLGCGREILKDFVNVDIHGDCFRHDLNVRPWPWADSSVSEIRAHHILEHLPDTISVMKEIYRVCADGAKVNIAVPHPRSDDYLNDPTHCSPITNGVMHCFSKKANEATANDANTPLALIHGVDFEIERSAVVVEERWMQRLEAKEINEQQLRDAIHTFNNVVKQIEMTLRVVKP